MGRTVFEICDVVRQTAFEIHAFHKHGHFEKIYENALVHRLRKAGLLVQQQHSIQVRDEDGTPLRDFFADLLVEGLLVVELKASRAIADEHIAQLLGYLRSTQIQHGLLINSALPFFRSKSSLAVRKNPPPSTLCDFCAFLRLQLCQ
jgi:GxxExxY protein